VKNELDKAALSKAMLLSIKPRFASAILDGDKTIELRRREPKAHEGTLVLMYASQPTCAIVGAFILGKIVRLPIAEFWTTFGTQTGVSKETYEKYYAGLSFATGLRVEKTWRLAQPISLETMRRVWQDFHPPQSYRYLRPSRSDTTSTIGLDFGARTTCFGL
jgi:predicted transcriptional regulator